MINKGQRERMPPPFVTVFDTNVLIPLSVPAGRSKSTRPFIMFSTSL